MPQLFFRSKYVWFPIHLKGPMIPDPSGHLAELIVYITSTRVDLYSHQILLAVDKKCLGHQRNIYMLNQAKQTYFKAILEPAETSKDPYKVYDNLLNR